MESPELASLAESLTHPGIRFETPVEAVRAFATALTLGDLEVALACFANESCFVTPDATTVSGRGGIRGVLAQLIAQRTKISMEASSTLFAGEVAFVNQHWHIRLGASPEAPYVQATNPVLVLRREDGKWKLAIAAPWAHSP